MYRKKGDYSNSFEYGISMDAAKCCGEEIYRKEASLIENSGATEITNAVIERFARNGEKE